jgi:hypothetical protein
MNDLQLKKYVLQALICIKENGADDLGSGICDNVVEFLGDEYSIDSTNKVFKPLFPWWNKYSGDCRYPVPSTNDDLTPKGMFGYAADFGELWIGEYGDLRFELLDFLIEQLTLEVRSRRTRWTITNL